MVQFFGRFGIDDFLFGRRVPSNKPNAEGDRGNQAMMSALAWFSLVRPRAVLAIGRRLEHVIQERILLIPYLASSAFQARS